MTTPLKERIEKEFSEKFDGLYYGKDEDNYPNYPPESFKEDVKFFIKSFCLQLLEEKAKEVGQTLMENPNFDEYYKIVKEGNMDKMFDFGVRTALSKAQQILKI